MLKLVLQIVVAVAIVVAANALNALWWIIVLLVFAGFAVVHFAWERLFFSPFVHLGAMPIANDDPLMLKAVERANGTWDRFLEIYPEHREDSMVKFRKQNAEGENENLWGDLLELNDDEAVVYLRTPPVGEMEIGDRRMTIPFASVVDWQVEYRDGSLRGGFTQQAAMKIYAREEGHMPPEFEKQLGRYREL